MRKVEVTYKLRSCYYLSIAMANMGHASIGAIRPKKFAKPLPQKSRRILFLTGANGLGYEVKGTKPNRRANITTMLARDWHPKYKQVVYRNENLRQWRDPLNGPVRWQGSSRASGQWVWTKHAPGKPKGKRVEALTVSAKMNSTRGVGVAGTKDFLHTAQTSLYDIHPVARFPYLGVISFEKIVP